MLEELILVLFIGFVTTVTLYGFIKRKHDNELRIIVLQTQRQMVALSESVISTQKDFLTVLKSANEFSSTMTRYLDALRVTEANIPIGETPKLKRFEGS